MNGNGFQWNLSITLSVSLIRNFFVNLWCSISCPAQFDRRDNFLQIDLDNSPRLSYLLKSIRIMFFKAKTWRFLSGLHCTNSILAIYHFTSFSCKTSTRNLFSDSSNSLELFSFQYFGLVSAEIFEVNLKTIKKGYQV